MLEKTRRAAFFKLPLVSNLLDLKFSGPSNLQFSLE